MFLRSRRSRQNVMPTNNVLALGELGGFNAFQKAYGANVECHRNLKAAGKTLAVHRRINAGISCTLQPFSLLKNGRRS